MVNRLIPRETPMMRQYNRVKAQYPDALVLFRMGDFYEAFEQDAVKMSGILGITLTKRANGGAADMDLAGFPYHALDTYLPKLVRAGERVAICEQLEDPKLAKSLVKRGVTEVVTPGVALEANVLGKENNFLASVSMLNEQYGIAFIDVSTGEFYLAQGAQGYIDKLLGNFQPKEVLLARGQEQQFEGAFGNRYYTTRMDDWAFDARDASHRLTEQFGTNGLRGFGVETMQLGISAAGSILAYLDLTKHASLSHVTGISRLDPDQYVWLDRYTLRNLEIFQPVVEQGRTLYTTVDRTLTPMGGRLLKHWLSFPLRDVAAIQARHGAVGAFVAHAEQLNGVEELLRSFGDLERLTSRASMGRISPREIAKLGLALQLLPPLKHAVSELGNGTLRTLAEQINTCQVLAQRIQHDVQPAPGPVGKDAIFNEGVDEELDRLRALHRDAKGTLNTMLQRQIHLTGISSLKVGFNNVFGYYFEVRNAHKDRVPEDWARKQTLVSAERYINRELKEYEQQITTAEVRILEIEAKLLESLVQSLVDYVPTLLLDSSLVAQIDVLASYAVLAQEKHWVCPTLDDSYVLEVAQGWHPVISDMLPSGQEYVPNSLKLDDQECQIMMLTGPNMSGKSALLRQTAIIVLLAQAGSYVPAEGARIGIVDKLFTRVGASDNISAGESTFMVEMAEAASILNNLSARSLILLDEIGRGTSTYDGISIAWAMAEYLHEWPNGRPKTLFATHYHELNDMAEQYPRIHNFSISTKEVDGQIIFLRKLEPHGSAHSFGIHVAKLAGMPPSVVSRAEQILKTLESRREQTSRPAVASDGGLQAEPVQLSVFQVDDPVIKAIQEKLRQVDVDHMTPVEALNMLNEIKKLSGL